MSKPSPSSPAPAVGAQDHLLTLSEVAGRLACSPGLVRRLGARGVLPKIKLGRLVRFRASDVTRLVAEGVPSGGSQTRLAA